MKDGAEAMDVYEQDPPKSYGDLEGAWYVWKWEVRPAQWEVKDVKIRA